MKTIAKALIGVGAIGGTVGAGLLARHYLSSENIQSKLEANDFELLEDNQANEQTWKDILTSYKKVAAKAGNKFKFEGFDGSGEEPESLSTLKRKCKDIVTKDISEDKDNVLFEKAKKWCIVPISVSELLKRDNYTPLSTDASEKTADQALWNKKIAEYKDEKNKDKRITGLEMQKEPRQDDTNLTNIKKQCKTIGESNNYTENFEDYLENYKEWCSNK